MTDKEKRQVPTVVIGAESAVDIAIERWPDGGFAIVVHDDKGRAILNIGSIQNLATVRDFLTGIIQDEGVSVQTVATLPAAGDGSQ